MGLRFSKMQGAGNDFVVLDRRDAPAPLPVELRVRLCDRHFGVGCDQLLSIEPPRSAGAAFAYGIWNRDGSPAGQCGNGARCVVAWARRAGIFVGERVTVDSPSGTIEARCRDDGIEIEMGVPDFRPSAVGFHGGDGDGDGATRIRFEWRDWPFVAVSMGNPQAVIEVAAVQSAPVEALGTALQSDPRFADRCNVGFVERVDAGQIRLRVFERGVGETLACGSGACAAVAVLHRGGRIGSEVAVHLPGGTLHIAWPGEGQAIRMRGPAEFVFEGELSL